jgi:hypothetical protein
MTDLSPKLREILSQWHPGQRPKVEKETEWTFFYKVGSKTGYKISKFWDEDFHVSPERLNARWPKMSADDRLEFVLGWSGKANWSNDDSEILEIVMRDGDDRIWGSCTSAFTRHSNKERAVDFLVQRLQTYLDGTPLNYFQALGIIGDRRAASAIRPYYEKYREAMKAEAITGVPDDVVFGPIPYFAYLCACGALVKLDGRPEYEQDIRKYLDHSSEQVRWWAEHALDMEGPTTIRRKAEHNRNQSD